MGHPDLLSRCFLVKTLPLPLPLATGSSFFLFAAEINKIVLVTCLTFHRNNVNKITRLNFLPPNSSLSSSTSSSMYSLREAVLFPFVAAMLSFISLRVCKRNSFKFGYPLGNGAHHYPLGPLRTFILMLPAWTRSAIISSKSGSSFFSCSSKSWSSSSSSPSSSSSSSSS